jgi:hypothetical protein
MKKTIPVLLLISIGCKQAYVPLVHSARNSILVVEGFINNGQDSTYISLTHTFSLNDTAEVTPELQAQLTVEGKDNSAYPLKEWGNGKYGVTSLALISVRYSIQVKQYVLTADAYTYWSNLQKNTEQIGSIFSPQPFADKGNVHNVADTSEQVVGFLSAGTLQKQRIFITPGQIPNWQIGSYEVCSIRNIPPDSLFFYLHAGINLPIDQEETPPGSGFYRYNIAATSCVDCTLIGTLAKPSYWP